MKWFLSFFFASAFVFLLVFGVNCCYGIIFPQKYSAEVSSASERFDVDKAIIYSVINIESHFDKNALSNKGAVGLMQIMPSTAEELAKELNIEDYDLKNPHHNILIGTYYINKLCKKVENLETALCAYNAGPANVSLWLKDEQKSLDGKTLQNIPFLQTKNYVEKFAKNFKYYSHKIKN